MPSAVHVQDLTGDVIVLDQKNDRTHHVPCGTGTFQQRSLDGEVFLVLGIVVRETYRDLAPPRSPELRAQGTSPDRGLHSPTTPSRCCRAGTAARSTPPPGRQYSLSCPFPPRPWPCRRAETGKKAPSRWCRSVRPTATESSRQASQGRKPTRCSPEYRVRQDVSEHRSPVHRVRHRQSDSL